MAKQDEYFGEAYEELDRLSADEKKRLEYETRLKYKRDKYAQLHYATRIGREEGERIGRRAQLIYLQFRQSVHWHS